MSRLSKHSQKVSGHSPDMSKVGVVIPTFNAARHWESLSGALDRQGIQSSQILIVDSASTDGTRDLASASGYQVFSIDHESFNHGGTRRMAAELMPWAEILIFLTQDAVPASHKSFRTLAHAFDNATVGAAYGRQLPRTEAGPIERHARLFNYPSVSALQTYSAREQFGLKAAFISNSFAAYRVSALRSVGGFPEEAIVGEDSVVACRMLIAQWKIAYVADAGVIHSHCFSLRQEFSRYFDIGVHHAREKWILSHFGKANSEGKRFLRSEFSYLFSINPLLIPVATVRTANKLLAYQMGRREGRLPWSMKNRLSAQPTFWHQERTEHDTRREFVEVKRHNNADNVLNSMDSSGLRNVLLRK